ncbi:fungal-specific transcription factor domain-containing protein [Trichoderma longibrachiatum]|uniref:Zn(2)-C6 fungal-type domain-containing protein n=1 Tax=Trichoderma longibrachiatum ATCC 18648 TaxID=983965 RepID=A0A2T4BWG4_TRILO|nr:hypothetical protein M440DRAFT_1404651 [Trichoderma longibrachiatum ATCC 18648]
MEEKPLISSLGIPRRRRHRLRASCEPCRARKSKCDGTRPSCLACLSRGRPEQCAYENAPPGQHKRMSIRQEPNLPPSSSVPISTPVQSTGGDSFLANTPAKSTATRNSIAAPHEKVDAEVASVCQDEAVFGPPSTHSFINRVIASIEPCSKPSTPASKPASSKPFLNDPIGFTVSNADDVRLDMDALLLPEKKLADSLTSTYFRYSHLNFPVLHRPTFMKKYDNLWQSTDSFSLLKYTGDDLLLLATINIVLAIGCQRSENCPANSRKRDAESLYRRSVRLISAETLDSYSFEIMQLFILRIIYLQYTSFASRCWSTLGIAQRVAHGLGLHKDAPGSMGQLEREMRRRVWHVLVIMDKISSFTFGWNVVTVSNITVSIPEPIDDEYLAEFGQASQPPDKPSLLDFFRYYRRLSDVPKEIADNIHLIFQSLVEQGSTSLLTTYISEIPKYCEKLDELLLNLPSHLQEANAHAVDECFQIQGQIMRTRTLYVKLTILRPCLLATVANQAVRSEIRKVKTGQSSSLVMGLLHNVNELCVSTAQAVLEQVHRHISTLWRASTWHTLRVTMGSATTLLAASLIPELNVDLNQEPNKTSWEQAIAIFEYYISYDVSAQGGIQALWDYRQKFEAAKRRGEPSNEAGRAEPQQYPQGDGAVVAESVETPPGLDGAADPFWLGADLSQAFYDWNWLDFDIPEILLS